MTERRQSPMALKAGGRASSLYAAEGFDDANGQAELAASYITQLREQAATVLGSTVAATLVPVEYNGDFNWSWTDGINVNQLTYNYISGAVTPSETQADTVQIAGQGTLAMLYQQLINGIVWQFSAADNELQQAALTNSQIQATSVVTTYVGVYGAPTAAQMTAAQAINPYITQPIDYIMMYAAGIQWAGIAKGQPGLSLTAMQGAANLRLLLQYAPPSAQPVIQAIVAYLNALGGTVRLFDMQSLGNNTLQQIKNNLTPNATNGGIALFNPPSSGPALGYSSNMTTSAILQDLNNVSQKATLSFTAQKTQSSSYDVAFQGSAGLSFGGALLNISAGTSFKGDVAGQQGSGSTMTITMVYPGVTIIPFFPTGYQGTALPTTGWFYEPILNQAWSNLRAGSAAAKSGFTFVGSIPGGITLGADGLAYIKALVVSGYPTITVDFAQGDYASFSSWLSTHTSVSVSLFGFIPLGGASVDTYTASASKSSSGTGFSLTLTPPAAGSQGQTIPVANQTVPVLAAQTFPLGVSQA